MTTRKPRIIGSQKASEPAGRTAGGLFMMVCPFKVRERKVKKGKGGKPLKYKRRAVVAAALQRLSAIKVLTLLHFHFSAFPHFHF